MNAIQTLDYFLSYAAYDSSRTFLTEAEHYRWVIDVLRENTIYTTMMIYEIMEEDRLEAKEHLEEMIPELELLIARLPGDAEAYGRDFRHSVHDEVKYIMEGLLDFMRLKVGVLNDNNEMRS